MIVNVIQLGFILLPGAALAGQMLVNESAFIANADGSAPAGWTTWSARAETAPRCYVDALHWRGKPGSLAVNGASNTAAHGGWRREVPGVEPGAWYRFTAYYRTDGVEHESLQVLARVDWNEATGKRAGKPDYVYKARREGEWTKLTTEAPAPAKASAAVLELFLSNSPQGTVWWDDISFERIDAPAPRPVIIATVNLRPQSTKSAAASVKRFIETIEKSAPAKTDVILLPEGITVIGTGKQYVDVAETIPGPTTITLGEVAKKRNTYIVAGIYEREAHVVYNTSVLIDRNGNVAGKYRKVYLPSGEVEGGLTPGNSYPVFETDFGTVGMMICYDVFFPDPARALVNRGAEIVLMPIWGGDLTLGKARAIENRVFLATSGYDYPTQVMDPDGEVLALAAKDGEVAVTTIDLNKRQWQQLLGDMRARRAKEYRVDVPVPVPGLN